MNEIEEELMYKRLINDESPTKGSFKSEIDNQLNERLQCDLDCRQSQNFSSTNVASFNTISMFSHSAAAVNFDADSFRAEASLKKNSKLKALRRRLSNETDKHNENYKTMGYKILDKHSNQKLKAPKAPTSENCFPIRKTKNSCSTAISRPKVLEQSWYSEGSYYDDLSRKKYSDDNELFWHNFKNNKESDVSRRNTLQSKNQKRSLHSSSHKSSDNITPFRAFLSPQQMHKNTSYHKYMHNHDGYFNTDEKVDYIFNINTNNNFVENNDEFASGKGEINPNFVKKIFNKKEHIFLEDQIFLERLNQDESSKKQEKNCEDCFTKCSCSTADGCMYEDSGQLWHSFELTDHISNKNTQQTTRIQVNTTSSSYENTKNTSLTNNNNKNNNNNHKNKISMNTNKGNCKNSPIYHASNDLILTDESVAFKATFQTDNSLQCETNQIQETPKVLNKSSSSSSSSPSQASSSPQLPFFSPSNSKYAIDSDTYPIQPCPAANVSNKLTISDFTHLTKNNFKNIFKLKYDNQYKCLEGSNNKYDKVKNKKEAKNANQTYVQDKSFHRGFVTDNDENEYRENCFNDYVQNVKSNEEISNLKNKNCSYSYALTEKRQKNALNQQNKTSHYHSHKEGFKKNTAKPCHKNCYQSLNNITHCNKEKVDIKMCSYKYEGRSGIELRDGDGIRYLREQKSVEREERSKLKRQRDKLIEKIQVFLQKKQLCDVVLRTTCGKSIAAHRLILAAHSDYFEAMFTNDVVEAQNRDVLIKGIQGDSLDACVKYIYTEELDLKEDTVESILEAACLLQLEQVILKCDLYLRDQLHPSNCVGIRHFADLQGCYHLYATADSFLHDHFSEVIKNQEFCMMSFEDMKTLLCSDNICVASEMVVFEALVAWALYNEDERKDDFIKLLPYVRLPLLPPQYIADKVATCSFLRDEAGCQELLMEALKYHLLPERRLTMHTIRTRPRKSTVGVLFAVGGVDCGKGAISIEKYDMRIDRWSVVASMNNRRLQFGVVVLDKIIYVVGGRDGLKTLNTVESFNPVSKKWGTAPSMFTPRHGLGIGSLGGPMYAVGGHDGWSYLKTVERWDPQVKMWSFVASLTTARSTAGVAVLANKLYVVGGRDGSCCLNSMECYDPHTNKWKSCSGMSKRRGGVGVAVCNDFLYVVGGHDSPSSNPASSRFDCVERYDYKTDSWTYVAPISSPRDAVGVCVLGEKIFAVGGYDGEHYLNDVESYDTHLDEWNRVSPLCISRAGASVVHLSL